MNHDKCSTSNKYRLKQTSAAKKQWQKLKSVPSHDKSKIEWIVEMLTINPFYRGNRAEPLDKVSPNIYSRRINRKDRVVYSVNESSHIITVISILGHYPNTYKCN
jgi:toxin YoeB